MTYVRFNLAKPMIESLQECTNLLRHANMG